MEGPRWEGICLKRLRDNGRPNPTWHWRFSLCRWLTVMLVYLRHISPTVKAATQHSVRALNLCWSRPIHADATQLTTGTLLMTRATRLNPQGFHLVISLFSPSSEFHCIFHWWSGYFYASAEVCGCSIFSGRLSVDLSGSISPILLERGQSVEIILDRGVDPGVVAPQYFDKGPIYQSGPSNN